MKKMMDKMLEKSDFLGEPSYSFMVVVEAHASLSMVACHAFSPYDFLGDGECYGYTSGYGRNGSDGCGDGYGEGNLHNYGSGLSHGIWVPWGTGDGKGYGDGEWGNSSKPSEGWGLAQGARC